MNIHEQEYMAVMDDGRIIMGALEKHRIDESTQTDVLATLYSLKGEIIRVLRPGSGRWLMVDGRW